MFRLALSFFLLLPFYASAATPQIMWFFSDPVNGGESGPHSSVASACGVLMGVISRGGVTATLSASEQQTAISGRCKYKNYFNGYPISDFNYHAVTGRPSCSGGLPVRSDGQCPDPAPDPSQCAANSGKETTINWTVGYTRTPTLDSDPDWKLVGPPNVVPADGVMCDPVSSCKVAASFSNNTAYQSRSPTAQGLYRLSLDMPAQHLGQSCTPSSAETAGASPQAPQPACPGAVGEVNGVLGCYGTASNPTRNDTPSAKPVPPVAGNPSAGQKPSSGEGSGTGGSGRTPTNGDGGPAGGPAGAAGGSGTKPDGTTPKPGEGKEQANCGAPGQPKCGIDETGTPTKYDGNGAAFDGWKEGVDKNRATIEKSGSGVFDSFNVFFSAPPIVGCEPIELPNKEVITRHCDVVGGTRAVMAYIWALSALWLCVGWIREAI